MSMTVLSNRLGDHFRGQGPFVLALCASSAMSVTLYAGRVYQTQSWTFLFLVWNLFLAWIPLLSALAVWRLARSRSWFRLLIPVFLLGWLVFFPNSPYIVTDLIHLDQRQNVPLWYDLMLLFTFAWNGLLLGFVSLWLVQRYVRSKAGVLAGWLMVGAALFLCGFGVYLGRFLRWNSWDVLVDPRGLALDVLARVTDPLAYPQTVGVTVIFATFLGVAYVTMALFLHAAQSADWRDNPRPERALEHAG